MRYLRQLSNSMRCLPVALPLCAALIFGCQGKVIGPPGVGASGTGGTSGMGGAAGIDVPCAGPSDPRMVVAPQRIMLLTKPEIINTVTYLIDKTEADALVSSGMVELIPEPNRHFPPADGEEQSINDTSILPLNTLAGHVSEYVTTNFSTLAKCATVTDACATTYLNTLAAKAYRRQLTTDEQTGFTNLYSTLKSQMVNGYAVTNTVQQAAGYAVWALLMSPQLVWRWEIGGTQVSSAPPGIYLTDDELASQVSFFLTDQPPDDMLLVAARAGTLRANLASHVSRILQTAQGKNWMRHVMELYFLLNQIPASPVDPTKFPVVDSGLLASMANESRLFLDNVLWGSSSTLSDLLLSRTTFVNDRLATQVYKIPMPAGATLDNFVQTTLPADQRSGILTNAGFLTARSRSDGQDLVSRGKAVKAAFLCIPSAPPDETLKGAIAAATATLNMQTGQQQAASRAGNKICGQCHATFDQYGLALEFYDAVAAYRTTYDYLPGTPAIDGTTTLPPVLGGATVRNAVELAQSLADSPTFTNCLATSMLQYAMTELNAQVQLPLAPAQSGCAAADVVQRYGSGSSKTFTGLVTAVTQSPAFVVRRAAP